MYTFQEKAFNQGMDDAWADREQNPQRFKSLIGQQRYCEGYTRALKQIENYYFKLLQDHQG